MPDVLHQRLSGFSGQGRNIIDQGSVLVSHISGQRFCFVRLRSFQQPDTGPDIIAQHPYIFRSHSVRNGSAVLPVNKHTNIGKGEGFRHQRDPKRPVDILRSDPRKNRSFSSSMDRDRALLQAPLIQRSYCTICARLSVSLEEGRVSSK